MAWWLEAPSKLARRLCEAPERICEGDCAHPVGIAKSNSSKARGLEDPYLENGCAAPTESLTLDSQLAHDPSSGCIATTGTSLVATK
jgi:hypothetical protein